MAHRYDLSTLVPSSRDFLMAVRTGRKGLALVPCLPAEDAAREALRMAEEDVTAIAMGDPSPVMAEAAKAVRIPLLSLAFVRSHEDALAARASGADAVLLDPDLDDAAREDAATSARSTRMVAIPVARNEQEVVREVERASRAIVLRAPDAKRIGDLASLADRVLLIAWPERPLEDQVGVLRGQVDAAIVGVDVYGVTGFERLVSELNP